MRVGMERLREWGGGLQPNVCEVVCVCFMRCVYGVVVVVYVAVYVQVCVCVCVCVFV